MLGMVTCNRCGVSGLVKVEDDKGNVVVVQPKVATSLVPVVRVSPIGRVTNEWLMKHASWVLGISFVVHEELCGALAPSDEGDPMAGVPLLMRGLTSVEPENAVEELPGPEKGDGDVQ